MGRVRFFGGGGVEGGGIYPAFMLKKGRVGQEREKERI